MLHFTSVVSRRLEIRWYDLHCLWGPSEKMSYLVKQPQDANSLSKYCNASPSGITNEVEDGGRKPKFQTFAFACFYLTKAQLLDNTED